MLHLRFRRSCRFRRCTHFAVAIPSGALEKRVCPREPAAAEGNRLIVVRDEDVPCAASSIKTGASWLPTKRKPMRQSPFMVHPRYLDFTLANMQAIASSGEPATRPIRSSIIFTFTLPDSHILNRGLHVYWRRKPTRRIRFRRITLFGR